MLLWSFDGLCHIDLSFQYTIIWIVIFAAVGCVFHAADFVKKRGYKEWYRFKKATLILFKATDTPAPPKYFHDSVCSSSVLPSR
jgi:hypothetical protein